MTNLLGDDGKVTSDKKIIYNSHKRYEGANRDYCSHFSVIFEITCKFLIVFIRIILGKVAVDRYTRPQWEIDIRYEFGIKVILKSLGWK